MAWLSATTVVPRDLAESLSDALLEAGALAVEVSDADAGTSEERPIFDEPGGAPAPGWSRGRISALFNRDADVNGALAAAFEATGVDAATAFEVDSIEERDWVRLTQAQFAPVKITERLWIVPTWHAPPDANAINIILDPGLAFGTGTHPTTRLCLRWLTENIRGGERVIDFGCGSGILAIAASKLGAAAISGIDIDSQAVAAASDNARANGVDATFVSAAEQLDAPADVVVANILAQPLIVLAPLIANLTARGGSIALSGILAGQAHEVRQVYAPWYDFEPAREDEGWVCLSAVRK